MGEVRCANCPGQMAQDGRRLRNMAKIPVSAQESGLRALNIQETGANLGDFQIVSLANIQKWIWLMEL
jgi:hypothetical protein